MTASLDVPVESVCVCSAASTLSALESPLNTLLAGHRLILPFCGVGHFKQEVAFVQIAEGEHLNTLALIAGTSLFLTPHPLLSCTNKHTPFVQ